MRDAAQPSVPVDPGPGLPGAGKPERAAATATPSAGEPTVLVVEDDGDIRVLLESWLAGLGEVVVSVATGEEGLLLARAHSPRLVLIDVLLPGMSGWDLVRALRAGPGTADLPVAVMSVLDEGGSGSEAGVRFLRKPFKRRDVESLVSSLALPRGSAGAGKAADS